MPFGFLKRRKPGTSPPRTAPARRHGGGRRSGRWIPATECAGSPAPAASRDRRGVDTSTVHAAASAACRSPRSPRTGACGAGCRSRAGSPTRSTSARRSRSATSPGARPTAARRSSRRPGLKSVDPYDLILVIGGRGLAAAPDRGRAVRAQGPQGPLRRRARAAAVPDHRHGLPAPGLRAGPPARPVERDVHARRGGDRQARATSRSRTPRSRSSSSTGSTCGAWSRSTGRPG